MSVSIVKDRLIRTLIIAAIGVCIVALVTVAGMMSSRNNMPAPAILNVSGVGGPWEMVDSSGRARTDKDFSGKYKIIYFGFASCPAVCPTELQKIATAYNGLSEKQKSKIQLLFVTVDPERDTPKVLKSYVALFDPTLIGLTGSLKQVEYMEQTYKVYAAKVPQGEKSDDYTMDHSSYIYFMSPDDKLIALFKTTQNADEIEGEIRKYLKQAS